MKIGCSCVDIFNIHPFTLLINNQRDHSSDSTFDLNPNLSLSNSFKY